MPVYTESIHQIIFEEDVRKMWKNAQYEYERVLLSLLWFSGARPSELLELKRKDVRWGVDDKGQDFFELRLATKKLSQAKRYVVSERILRSSRPLGEKANLYIETIIRWCLRLQPEDYVLIHRSRVSINRAMHKLSKTIGHVWSAYHFRHSVFTHMARNNASLTTLMYWKGASNILSVQSYIQALPVYIQIENQRRERDPTFMPQKSSERYSAEVIEREENV